MDNIEKKVSKTVLQIPEEIVIGDTTYQVASPSTATLILMSEAISIMPKVNLSTERVVDESLYIAKDCRVEGDIIAIMILGAKGLTETTKVPKTIERKIEKIVYEEYLFGLVKRPRKIIETVQEVIEIEETIDKKAILSKKLLEDVSPTELMSITSHLLRGMQISDFFGLTTFLIEINLLRKTKVEETTVSGQ